VRGTSAARAFWGSRRSGSFGCDDRVLDRPADHPDGPPSPQLGDDKAVEEEFPAQVFRRVFSRRFDYQPEFDRDIERSLLWL
jgi:hypothetical protein